MSLSKAPLTIALLVVNALIFVVDYFILGHGDIGPLMAAGAIIPQQIASGEYYRLITAGFLHFNITHIAFNSYALAQAGMVVENLYGTAAFAAIYGAGLIAGNVLAYETTIGTNDVTAGASTAIMGLFGAMVALGLKTPPLRETLLKWASFPIIATLAVGFSTPGISNAGHIGGVIGGAIAGYLIPATRLRAGRWD
jgi:membrane associated rhomboid family serine protease